MKSGASRGLNSSLPEMNCTRERIGHTLFTLFKPYMRQNEYTLDCIFVSSHIAIMKQIEIFQMLADQTRLRALALIEAEGELCVCELVAALDLSQPKISRHLAAMRDAGLLTSRRDAQWVFYHINTALPDWQQQVINAAMAGLTDEPLLQQDSIRLTQMKNRPERCTAA